jgi:hypothetical protein
MTYFSPWEALSTTLVILQTACLAVHDHAPCSSSIGGSFRLPVSQRRENVQHRRRSELMNHLRSGRDSDIVGAVWVSAARVTMPAQYKKNKQTHTALAVTAVSGSLRLLRAGALCLHTFSVKDFVPVLLHVAHGGPRDPELSRERCLPFPGGDALQDLTPIFVWEVVRAFAGLLAARRRRRWRCFVRG